MAKTIKVNCKYRVTSGKLTGFVGRCYAADFTDNGHGHFILLEVDDVSSIFVHPKDVEIVTEPDALDLRQVLITEL